MKLLVRNLAKATTEDKLLSLFKEYGNVQSCNLVLDKETGASKGFAFIEMPKVGEAKAAIKQLNSYKLAGNLIRVKKAETKKEAAPETPVATVKPAKEAVQTETAEMVDPATVWGEVKDEIKE
ncbi:RNA-binding protein [Psychromonas sp. B3M02]|uniref:RNA recognition motif domain-containing protein n=1 Tax=Psychromonas sp. B3M02 TaxID=2267226 RepID=UPI000DEB8F36|nr:RNA-binding protein [Psychromonas sp. B3M02]RBW42750.1 RNA-binding protein [Psychromonas sp. B3M02]